MGAFDVMTKGVHSTTIAPLLATRSLNFVVFFVGVIIALIMAVAIMVIWGITMLIGFILIVGALAVILLDRGKVDMLFYVALMVGVLFIILNLLGIGSTQVVDLRTVPILQNFADFFH